MIAMLLEISLPLLFLGLSSILILAYRKPLSHWIGEFSFLPRETLMVLFQLLIIGIGFDFIARGIGINDTQNVSAVAAELALTPLVSIFYLAVSAVSEEVFFRGIAYRLVGGIGSALLFTAFHAGYHSSIELLGAFAAGIILVHARTKYGNIYPGLGGHLLYNLLAVFVLGNL